MTTSGVGIEKTGFTGLFLESHRLERFWWGERPRELARQEPRQPQSVHCQILFILLILSVDWLCPMSKVQGRIPEVLSSGLKSGFTGLSGFNFEFPLRDDP